MRHESFRYVPDGTLRRAWHLGLDGYQTEFVVDREPFVVRVAPELEAVGVLAEPFSVAEKAISEAIHLQLTRSNT